MQSTMLTWHIHIVSLYLLTKNTATDIYKTDAIRISKLMYNIYIRIYVSEMWALFATDISLLIQNKYLWSVHLYLSFSKTLQTCVTVRVCFFPCRFSYICSFRLNLFYSSWVELSWVFREGFNWKLDSQIVIEIEFLLKLRPLHAKYWFSSTINIIWKKSWSEYFKSLS